jgi:hypothetical protein
MKNLIIKLWKSDVKTSCCIYENRPIWELGEFEKNKILITWPVLTSPNNIYIYIYENWSGFHYIIREPKPLDFHKKSANQPTLS